MFQTLKRNYFLKGRCFKPYKGEKSGYNRLPQGGNTLIPEVFAVEKSERGRSLNKKPLGRRDIAHGRYRKIRIVKKKFAGGNDQEKRPRRRWKQSGNKGKKGGCQWKDNLGVKSEGFPGERTLEGWSKRLRKEVAKEMAVKKKFGGTLTLEL